MEGDGVGFRLDLKVYFPRNLCWYANFAVLPIDKEVGKEIKYTISREDRSDLI